MAYATFKNAMMHGTTVLKTCADRKAKFEEKVEELAPILFHTVTFTHVHFDLHGSPDG